MVALARLLPVGTEPLLDKSFNGVAPALSQRLSKVVSNLRGNSLSVLIDLSRATHRQPINPQRRLAHAHRHALAFFAAGTYAAV